MTALGHNERSDLSGEGKRKDERWEVARELRIGAAAFYPVDGVSIILGNPRNNMPMPMRDIGVSLSDAGFIEERAERRGGNVD